MAYCVHSTQVKITSEGPELICNSFRPRTCTRPSQMSSRTSALIRPVSPTPAAGNFSQLSGNSSTHQNDLDLAKALGKQVYKVPRP